MPPTTDFMPDAADNFTNAATADSLASLPRLGVGVLYNAALSQFIRSDLDALDFAEIIPDLCRTDRGMGQDRRFMPLEPISTDVDWLAGRRPVVAHSIGMSIGTAGLFDSAYLDELATWQRRYRFPWHSEHLSVSRLPGTHGPDRHTALALPVPYDQEALNLIVERIRRIQHAVPVPLLLENNVYFTAIPEQEMTEPEFLNALTAATGCGLLLDLHNLYANARNHGFNGFDFLGQLDLTRVVEIHVAGGSDMDGIYTDSHAGPVPEEVWALLSEVVAQAPTLRAVIFEPDESYYPIIGRAGVRACVDRARGILCAAA